MLAQGIDIQAVACRPIWHREELAWTRNAWLWLTAALHAANEHWEVWTEWYEARLEGRPANKDLELARARISEEIWEQGPKAVNAHIKELIEKNESSEGGRAPETKPPPEPEAGPGPDYGVKGGKLAILAHAPTPDEVAPQAKLHARLRKKTADLLALLTPVENQFPELSGAVREYAELVSAETEKLDVTGLFSVGGALAAFSGAYRDQNTERTLATPLEPQLAAGLASLVRDHGPFILGFEEGRELMERADRFALDAQVIAKIEEPGNALLNELTENRELVEEQTRNLHRPVRDAVDEFGWQAGRAGFSAYLIIRKAVHATMQFLIGEKTRGGQAMIALLGGAAATSTVAGDPNAEFVRAALTFLRDYSAQIISYFNHSPEFRAYVDWVLRTLDADHRDR